MPQSSGQEDDNHQEELQTSTKRPIEQVDVSEDDEDIGPSFEDAVKAKKLSNRQLKYEK